MAIIRQKTVNQKEHIRVETFEGRCVKKMRTYRGQKADTFHCRNGYEARHIKSQKPIKQEKEGSKSN